MISHSTTETKEIALHFLEKIILKGLDKTATVVALYGDLGSGKTTFVQLVAKTLDIQEQLQSPTFVIMKSYKLPHSTFKNFIHIDAYRLNSVSEIEKLGWSEIISNPENLVFVEWPEKIEEVMPKNSIRMDFKFIDENSREINTVF